MTAAVPPLEQIILDVRRNAQKSERERIELLELALQQIKNRLALLERPCPHCHPYQHYINAVAKKQPGQPPPRKRDRAVITDEERRKIDAYIASGKVKPCPPSGDPALAEHHAAQNAYWDLSWKERSKKRRGRPSTLTPEQRKEKQREAARRSYQKHKAKRLAAMADYRAGRKNAATEGDAG